MARYLGSRSIKVTLEGALQEVPAAMHGGGRSARRSFLRQRTGPSVTPHGEDGPHTLV